MSETTARNELIDSLRKLGAKKVILSTNIELRLDGLPYANRRTPDDVGVAVYFTRNGEEQVIACDCWDRIGDNYRALGLAVDSLRQLERCGASEILNRAFTGFSALPAANQPPAWREILELSSGASIEDVHRAFREKAKGAHPDNGGTNEAFLRLTAARDAALQEVTP